MTDPAPEISIEDAPEMVIVASHPDLGWGGSQVHVVPTTSGEAMRTVLDDLIGPLLAMNPSTHKGSAERKAYCPKCKAPLDDAFAACHVCSGK